MNASNRKDRNGPPLSVTIVTTGRPARAQRAGAATPRRLVGPAAQLGGLGQGELDRGYRVVLVRGRLARSPRRPVPDGRGVRARPEVISVRNELGVARPAALYLANELHRGECVAAEPCSGLAAPFVSPPP